MTIPTFDLTIASPRKMTIPTIVGGGVAGGVSQLGDSQAIDFTGGGVVTVGYSSIFLRSYDPKYIRTWSRYQGILNNGVRSMIVPLFVNYYQPPFDGNLNPKLTRFSDGTLFSDGAFFSQPSVESAVYVTQAAALNAGQLTIRAGGRQFVGGEWLGIVHPTMLNRAYMVTDVISSGMDSNGFNTFVVAIRPTLREAITGTVSVNLDNPDCIMKLQAGKTLMAEVDNIYKSTPDVVFIESLWGF